MAYQVVITRKAENDLYQAIDYIAYELQSLPAAKRLAQKLKTGMESLKEMPYRHPLIKDQLMAAFDFRMLTIENYAIFYKVIEETNTVIISRILYIKSNWQTLL